MTTTEAMPKTGDQLYAAHSGRFLGLIGVIARSEIYNGVQIYEVRTQVKYELNQGPITYWTKRGKRGNWVTCEGPNHSASRGKAIFNKFLARVKFLDGKGGKKDG
jgi:hypothetical protein